MASLLEALEARERAARARVEALRAEMDRLAERLAAEQALLGRLEITRQTVVEVLAGEELPSGGAVVADPDPKAGVGAGSGCRWPTGTWWRWWPMPARCVPGGCARRWGPASSPAIGRGCGSSSSGWWSMAGWSRPSRGCSPAPGGWLRRWTAPADPGAGLVQALMKVWGASS